jgi:hypothetical protein
VRLGGRRRGRHGRRGPRRNGEDRGKIDRLQRLQSVAETQRSNCCRRGGRVCGDHERPVPGPVRGDGKAGARGPRCGRDLDEVLARRQENAGCTSGAADVHGGAGRARCRGHAEGLDGGTGHGRMPQRSGSEHQRDCDGKGETSPRRCERLASRGGESGRRVRTSRHSDTGCCRGTTARVPPRMAAEHTAVVGSLESPSPLPRLASGVILGARSPFERLRSIGPRPKMVEHL